MSATTVAVKAASVILGDERGRKAVGWILVAVFSPLILLIAIICGLGAGSAEHNHSAVDACFFGTVLPQDTPQEYRTHVAQMRNAFSVLDSAVAGVNTITEGGSLDSIRIKAVFCAFCFGEDAPSQRAASRFVECFYTLEERPYPVELLDENGEPVLDEEGNKVLTEAYYTVAIPRSPEAAYTALATELGREITADDRENVLRIYSRVAGTPESGVYGGGSFERGGGAGTEIDLSGYVDPDSKNAADLATFALHAWEQGWGYVWGTCGWVLTEGMLAAKLTQYPEGVGKYEDLIRSAWLGGRTADCVGLIKAYGWLDAASLTIGYGTNGMPDISANQMFYAAQVSGTIDTIPEVPGLAVWRDGHIGIYIGNGEIIEAMGTRYGVVLTLLSDGRFTHWLQVPYIDYN